VELFGRSLALPGSRRKGARVALGSRFGSV